VVVGTKVRLPNAELGRFGDAVATSLEGSLGATAPRSGWHPFICTRDHRHTGGGDMLGVRQVLEDVVPAFEWLRREGTILYLSPAFCHLGIEPLPHSTVDIRGGVHEGWCNGNYYSPTSD
jgi:hypothetical protein